MSRTTAVVPWLVTWHERAACAGQDPARWDELPPPTTPGARTSHWGTGPQRRAIAICHECPVRLECLRAALTEERGVVAKHRFTIRGGLTPNQRAAIDKAGPRR